MEFNQQAPAQNGSSIRINGSNVLPKNSQYRPYENLNIQSSTVHQNKVYDSEYRTGFPKLYSFDTSIQNKSRNSLDEKGKYSFRNDYSKIVEQNHLLYRQNISLKEEITRLTTIIQTERKTIINKVDRSEIDRLNGLLNQKDTEIRSLKERIFALESQGSRVNQWQIRFNESQTIIGQLNVKINSMSQQLSQYETKTNQLNMLLNQYKTQITQLNIQISEYMNRISQLERQQKPALQPKTDVQIDQLRNQIYSLKSKISQYEFQISQYEKTTSQYESQISSLQQVNWRQEQRVFKAEQSVKKVTEVKSKQVPVEVNNEKWLIEQGKLNFRIIILLEEINRLRQKESQLIVKAEELHAYLLRAENYIEEIQLELEKNNLKENVPTYIVEKITHLQEENTKYTILIEELQSRLTLTQINGVSEDQHFAQLGERDFRIIILMEEINRLNQKVTQTRKYLESAQSYIQQIQKTIEERQTVIPPEIENQLTYLSQQNHRLNLLIQNYIDQIKHLKVNLPAHTKVEFQIPPEVEHKISFLSQQHEKLNAYIIELENRPPVQIQVQVPSEPIVKFQIPPEVENRLAFLALENERLTAIINELQAKPARVEKIVETIIQQKVEFQVPPQVKNRLTFLSQEYEGLTTLVNELQSRLQIAAQANNQQLQTDYAKIKFRVIILLEQINRLNHKLEEVSSYLVNAENFIEQLEIRLNEQPPVQQIVHQIVKFVVPEQTEQEMAKMTLQRIILLEQINRLNHKVQEILSQLINAENYIEQCEIRFNEMNENRQIEFQIPPEIENRLAFLALENERLTAIINELQSKPPKVEKIFETIIQQKIEFKIPPEIERRVNVLASENERLQKLLSQVQAHKAEQSAFELAKLQFRIIILLEEINRLNHFSEELRKNLITAEQYIYEFENRPPQVVIPAELQNDIFSLRTENQNLHAELNRVSLEFEQKITLYKTEISNINSQLSTFRTEATTYKSKLEELEIKSAQTESQLQDKWAKQHFRTMILMQEINRLNFKLSNIDAERVEVIGYLVNAENYIQDLEGRISRIQQGSKQTIFNNTMNEGSTSAILELNNQLFELENRGEFEIAQRDFRVIMLLEQINRLNHKVKQISVQEGSELPNQLALLQQAKQQTERQLHDVLNHLRQAEEYIGTILRDNQELTQERDHYINELNKISKSN